MADERYIIFSIERGMWWKPNQFGYTGRLEEAGRYTREEAEKICEDANLIEVCETMALAPECRS